MADLRLVLVTPEKTLFDRPVASIRVPLFDGSAGFYPGRAPLVGRLGVGELRLTDGNGVSESYFVDGGFVQVKGAQVSVLTNAAVAASEISRKESAAKLEEARATRAISEEERNVAVKKLQRARALLRMASKD